MWFPCLSFQSRFDLVDFGVVRAESRICHLTHHAMPFVYAYDVDVRSTDIVYGYARMPHSFMYVLDEDVIAGQAGQGETALSVCALAELLGATMQQPRILHTGLSSAPTAASATA